MKVGELAKRLYFRWLGRCIDWFGLSPIVAGTSKLSACLDAGLGL